MKNIIGVHTFFSFLELVHSLFPILLIVMGGLRSFEKYQMDTQFFFSFLDLVHNSRSFVS